MKFLDKFIKKEKPQETQKPAFDYPDKITVVMPDGSLEDYPCGFQITDGINAVHCQFDRYHTSFDCKELLFEIKSGLPVKGMTIREAEEKGFHYCHLCESYAKMEDD